MKLSVIICLYNTDTEYFNECLRSVTESTLPASSYEIVVVDDGSTTDYSDVLKNYKVIYKKTENRGIFLARLEGIAMSSGEYIVFVDSDDSVSCNYHYPMLIEAIDNSSDIVFNDWAFSTEHSKYFCKRDSTIAKNFFADRDGTLIGFTEKCGKEHAYYVLWNKLFKASLMKQVRELSLPIAEKGMRFNYGEDALMTFFAFKHADRVTNVHSGYYFYRIHSAQSINVISETRLRSQIQCMSEVFDVMLENSRDNVYKDQVTENIIKWRELMSRTHYSHAKANNYCQLYDFIKQKYKVSKLRRSKFSDGSAYASTKLLPRNFALIDMNLLAIWRDGSHLIINPSGAGKYAHNTLKFMKKVKGTITFSSEGIRLPKPKIKLITRLIRIAPIYYLGLFLFPKGSRVRAFLKKRL
jgi:glycosyltransferase involved in cell wall biosynthesis